MVRERLAVGRELGHGHDLGLDGGLRWRSLRVLASAALGPACCAVVLHDGRTVAAGATVETALLADGAWVLIGLVLLRPAFEVERGLYVRLIVLGLGDCGLEGVHMAVGMHVWVAQGEVLWPF